MYKPELKGQSTSYQPFDFIITKVTLQGLPGYLPCYSHALRHAWHPHTTPQQPPRKSAKAGTAGTYSTVYGMLFVLYQPRPTHFADLLSPTYTVDAYNRLAAKGQQQSLKRNKC